MYPYRKRCRGELLPESLGWRCHSEPRFEPKSSGCCRREHLETDHILRSTKKAFKKRKKCQKIEKKIAKDPPAKTMEQSSIMQTSGLSLSQRAAEPDSGDASISRGGGRRVGRPSKLPPSPTSPTPGRRVQAPKNQDTELWGGLPLGPCPCKHLVCPKRASAEVAKGEKTEKDVQKKEEDFVGFVV